MSATTLPTPEQLEETLAALRGLLQATYGALSAGGDLRDSLADDRTGAGAIRADKLKRLRLAVRRLDDACDAMTTATAFASDTPLLLVQAHESRPGAQRLAAERSRSAEALNRRRQLAEEREAEGAMDA